MSTHTTSSWFRLIALVLVIAVAGYYVLNRPDDLNAGEKISDAVSELKDRTPAERLQDKLETQN